MIAVVFQLMEGVKAAATHCPFGEGKGQPGMLGERIQDTCIFQYLSAYCYTTTT